MFKSQSLVVMRRNAVAIVLDFDSLKALVLEANIYGDDCQNALGSRCWATNLPMIVAPASRLFSTNSLTTEHRSTMT